MLKDIGRTRLSDSTVKKSQIRLCNNNKML